MFFLQNVDKVGPGFCPEYVRKAGSGIAADQTNAMLATSKGGDFSSLREISVVSPTLAERRHMLRGGVFTCPRRESRTQRLLWPQTAWFCADAGVCSASVFSDAEGGKAVDSRLSTLLFQIQSRRESDAEQRQKCRCFQSSAVA